MKRQVIIRRRLWSLLEKSGRFQATKEGESAGGREGGGGGGGSNGGATAADGRYHVHAPQCWFGGKRVSKAKAFNNEQEKYLGQQISTARLARVQEAMKQLKENNRVGAEKASGGAASCSSRKTP